MIDPPEPTWTIFSWKTAIGTALSLGTGILGFLGAALTLRAKHHETDAAKEIALRKTELDERTHLDAVTNERLDQLVDDIRNLRIALKEAHQDAVNGWNLARFWNGKAHELNHRLNNLKMVAAELAQQAGKPINPDWEKGSALPPFDQVSQIIKNFDQDEV